jgi:UDP-glucose 4-epimerase
VHLAGIAHLDDEEGDCLHKINVEGTKLLINAAIAKKAKKFVLVSSSLAAEPGDTSGTSTVYGLTKLLSERLVMEEHRNGSICGVVLRPVNVYGAGMRGNIAFLIRLISRGLIPSLPRLENSISLLSVGDLSIAINLSLSSEQANGKTYQVTDGQSYQISEIERGIYKALGKEMNGWKLPRVLLYSAFFAGSFLARVLKLFRLKPPILGRLNLRSYRKLVSDNLFENNKICEELLFQPKSTFYTELPEIVEKINR